MMERGGVLSSSKDEHQLPACPTVAEDVGGWAHHLNPAFAGFSFVEGTLDRNTNSLCFLPAIHTAYIEPTRLEPRTAVHPVFIADRLYFTITIGYER